MATTRNWDGSPETERDTRFYNLRDSGWTGPIDQDGYAVASGLDAAALRCAAERNSEDNW